MKITFLGTGTSQGIPVIACECDVCTSTDLKDKRLRSSVLITQGNTQLIIDAGPDFREQMLREKVMHLDAILLTHEHRDHTAGLDDVRAYNHLQKKPMKIFAKKRVLDALKVVFDYAFVSSNRYEGVPEFLLEEVDQDDFYVNDLYITPIQVQHFKLPILGYRIGDFAYITDAKQIKDEEIDKLKGVKILTINALKKSHHIAHFDLTEALDIIHKVKPQKAYLTHVSHFMGKQSEVSEELPEGVEFAYDGLQITL